MKKIVSVAIALVVIALESQGQTTTKKESIKLLFNLMQQDSLIDRTFDLMSSSMIVRAAPTSQDTAYTRMMTSLMEKNMKTSKELARRLINEDMVDMYDKNFTGQEIQDFITFYKSKSGQQMIKKLPEIQKEVMSVMATKYTPIIQQTMMKDLESPKTTSNQK